MYSEYVKRLIAQNLGEAELTGAAWAKHKKQGQPEQIYRVRYEPQLDGGGQLVAADSLRSYGTRNLASKQRGNAERRDAAQALLDLNVNYDSNKAADKYAYVNQLLGKEVHHLTEIDTFIRALRSASPEAQIKGTAALLNDGFTFGDHPRNQVALFGDPANVPGARTRAGDRNLPQNHPGKGEHQTDGGVHQRIDEIHNLFNLPNTNELESLERYMGSLTPSQQEAYIQVLGQIHRKGIQDVKNVGESAKKRTTLKLEEALSDLYMSNLRSSAPSRFATERSELSIVPELTEALQAIESGRDTQASGLVAGEKPTVINAGEGSRVYVEAGNGNGNSNKAEKIKAILKNGNGHNGKR